MTREQEIERIDQWIEIKKNALKYINDMFTENERRLKDQIQELYNQKRGITG